MSRPHGIHVAIVLCAAACAPDRPPVATAGDLRVFDAYAPASAAPDVGAAYFTVANLGAGHDTLLTVSTSARTATLHAVVEYDGLSRMQAVPALAIGPADTVRLEPGGYHLMLGGLEAPLRRGDTITVFLTFAGGASLAFDAPVLTYTEVVERLDRGGRR